jgi:general secretion pathway protein D
MQERSKRLIAATALCLTVAGCATTGALRSARSAETQQDYDRAVVEYSRALKLDPDNVDARTGLQRAKVRSAQDHYVRGRRLAAAGQLANAVNEYQLATELNPDAAEIQTELQSAQNQLRAQVAVNREGKTELESLIDRMRDMAPRGRELPSTAPLPDSLVFRNANSQEVITALARMANVNVVFDPAFRPTTIPALDLRGQTFDQAMQAIGASTQTFFRVTAPGTITVIPDTPAKRREYEEEAVKTFYLSNAEPKETADLLRIVIDARQIAVSAPNNAISIRDTPERLAAAGRLIEAIDKARPEVVVDTELLEVNRTRLNEFGLQLASSGSAGINGVADVNKTGLTLANLENLSATDVLLTSVPALYYRLLKSDQNTRVLANTNLRATAGLVAQTRFGERVPVPVTTFSPIATGGVAQQPITSYNYENIGVNIDITPRIHMDNSVTLTMKITVTSISGTGFGGLPTFGNREITTQLRLKDGETNMLAGLIRDDEIKLREGIPGIGDLPGVGRLFSHTNNQRNQSDIILMLTPHIVRTLDLKEDDLRSFLMGRDLGTGVGSGLELPLPGLPPPTQAPPQAVPPQQNPAAPVQPLTPPAPPPTPAPQGQQPTNPTPAPPQG